MATQTFFCSQTDAAIFWVIFKFNFHYVKYDVARKKREHLYKCPPKMKFKI